MYFAVRNYIILNLLIAKLIPFVEEKYALFERLIKELQVMGGMQKDAITGITKEKTKLKKALIKTSEGYSKILAAIAKFANDDKLMDKVRFRISDLTRMTDVALKDYAQIIYDKVEANIGNLAQYEITTETQKNFKELINSYDASLSTPRTGIADRSQTTRKLSALFAAADAALLELDFAIEAGESKQPDFCNGYKAVRKVIDTGSGKLALKATAIDLASGERLKGVIFIFHADGAKAALTGGNGEIIKKTADKGIFLIKNMPAGAYKVAVNKSGYKEKEVTVNVVDGERSELIVELEKA